MGSGFRLFTFRDVPVQVSGWYLALLGYFCYVSGLQSGLIWAVAVTASLLVHEFGHALVARKFRLSPWVELMGWGGLTHHQRAERDRDDALIIAAGPAAGLAFGGLVWLGQLAADVVAPGALSSQPVAAQFVSALLFINLIWSLVNLAPLWPLDGGQLFRLAMLRVSNPARAEKITHIVGCVVGVAAIYFAYEFGFRFALILAVLLTVQNATRISSTTASGAIRSKNPLARELLKRAETAFAEGDYKEAARLCHQARAESNVDTGVVQRTFEILGISCAHLGEYREALSYLKRTPNSGLYYQARVRCVLFLEDRNLALELVENKEFHELPEGAQQALHKLLASEASLG